jgi:hypothetical protein
MLLHGRRFDLAGSKPGYQSLPSAMSIAKLDNFQYYDPTVSDFKGNKFFQNISFITIFSSSRC